MWTPGPSGRAASHCASSNYGRIGPRGARDLNTLDQSRCESAGESRGVTGSRRFLRVAWCRAVLGVERGSQVTQRGGKNARGPGFRALHGGAEGTRTPDPHTASVVRYQLRHSPVTCPGKTPPGPRRYITRLPHRLRTTLSPRTLQTIRSATRRRPIPPGLRGMRGSEQYWYVATPRLSRENP
jgi:hypothetical protein